ncbi:cytochrome P450 [Paenibacillus psychroresistens]|uniref:Cytochrome P450 n=1 Tax=Paenibacillus psychroresistens TaxID=1778678 RepID=A0A6B8RPU4_9BACL|nr:cytochrome P450 [Paenibacillus psychroresistens]QGQ97834.1 cytochrome P450 [Paenibacillus psychroresistens]
MKIVKYANEVGLPELDSIEKRLLPFKALNELRQSTPIRYDNSRDCWDLFNYEDIHRVLKDPATFSSTRGPGAGTSILLMDPPRHGQMRDLVNKVFTPRAIQELAPRIQAISDELIQQLHGDDMDIVRDYATPLPIIVIAELLGVPAEDRHLFKRWSDVLVESAEDSTDAALAKLNQKKDQNTLELKNYFQNILEIRRKNPQEDLISSLLKAEIDGKKLTEDEVIIFCVLLLAAGNETTTNLITNSIRILTEEPDIQVELYKSLDSIPSFVEEVLRYYPPVISVGRIAKQDVQIGLQTIKAGEQVTNWIGAANRDPLKFANPNNFEIERKPNPHMSFGYGIHFCLGAPLARLEAKISLQTLLSHIREIKLVSSINIVPIPSTFVFGVKNYPISFTRS